MHRIALMLIWVLAAGCNNNSGKEPTGDSTTGNEAWKEFPSNHSFDSLMKYTIPVSSRFAGQNSGNGSGFVYTRDRKRFFVSNMHIFTGINYLTQGPTIEYEYRIDSNVLWFKSNGSKITSRSYPSIKYSKELKSKLNLPYDLDLYKIEMSIPDSFKITPINNLVDPTFFDKTPDSVFCYGFGGDYLEYHHTPSDWVNAIPQLTIGTPVSYNSFMQKMGYNFRKSVSDLMNDEYFFISKRGETGLSGSPVFGKFTTDDHKSVVKFVGIACWIQNDLGYTWVIKAKYVYLYLHDYK